MSRALWFAAGAASGVYGLVKARRTAQAFTPDGVGARVAAWQVGARAFGAEVRAGMVERETQLRDQLRLGANASRQIENPPTGRDIAEGSPDGHR